MSEVDIVGRSGAWLSAVELGLGSFLHAFHIPLTGYFLSLNQIYLLARTTHAHASESFACRLGLSVSGVAALLKSLAPAGKKLTPMLAISMQGFLFSVGTFLFGTGRLGIVCGGVLASVWAFIQAPLIALLIFGQNLIIAIKTLEKQVPSWLSLANVTMAIVVLVILKALVAVVLCLVATRRSFTEPPLFEQRLYSLGSKRSMERVLEPNFGTQNMPSAIRGAFNDLLNVWFAISLILTIGFFIWAEASFATVLWGVLRPVAIAFILFLCVRLVPMEKIMKRASQTRFNGFANAVVVAVQTLQRVE